MATSHVFFSPHLRWLKFEVCCICCSICLKNPQHDVHVPSTSTSQNHPKVPFKKNCDDFPTPNGTRRLNSVSQAMKTPPKYCCALLRSSLLKESRFFHTTMSWGYPPGHPPGIVANWEIPVYSMEGSPMLSPIIIPYEGSIGKSSYQWSIFDCLDFRRLNSVT